VFRLLPPRADAKLLAFSCNIALRASGALFVFARLSISVRLRIAVGVLALLIVAAGVSGLAGMARTNAALGYAYSNQLAAALGIGKTNLNLTIARTTLDRILLHPDSPDAPQLLDKAQTYLDTSSKAWEGYRALPHDAEEQTLADAVQAALTGMLEQGIQPLMAAIKQGDRQAQDDIAMKRIPPLSVVLTKASAELETWQKTHGQQAFERANERYSWLRAVSIALIVLGLGVAGVCAVGLHRAIAAPLENVQGALQRIASGDLTAQLEARSSDEMGRLVAGLKAMQDELARTVRKVTHSSESISTATKQIAAGNDDLSQRTEEQAASLQETAASMEQLTATVKQNAENARTAQSLANSAQEVADRGAEVVSHAVQTMDRIDNSSQKIADITGIIEGIAFQTNILALNAAVEAARAGEQGRGFAVVASEVRSLAQRSAAAAKEIKTLIGESVEHVSSGSQYVRSAGDRMTEIGESIVRVTTIMREIANASEEQRDGIEQVNLAVSQMDQVSQQNAALVEEAAAAAMALSEQASALREAVGAFRLAR
jgi:methyl-accepting chemotaxis protein I, serine sensor receptor